MTHERANRPVPGVQGILDTLRAERDQALARAAVLDTELLKDALTIDDLKAELAAARTELTNLTNSRNHLLGIVDAVSKTLKRDQNIESAEGAAQRAVSGWERVVDENKALRELLARCEPAAHTAYGSHDVFEYFIPVGSPNIALTETHSKGCPGCAARKEIEPR